ncbi:hypothetical protein [Streptomyces sp. SID2888]|uniref:hypothetical protein n=1 Tax=Streptomyces TaxID=1883 RepID=UPI00136C65F2|nr:hypothetical protein [Streptomyces sp. SID2888]MYV44778.1 hypothetical protein [Streptomyces sp. SID2888]
MRIDAATDLTESREYAGLPERERLVKATSAEAAWLAGQWERAGGARIELRYRNDPEQRRLTCAILARVDGPGLAAATTAAVALRDRLNETPFHVQSSAITDTAELATWLKPFVPHPAGLADIRKRIRVGRPNRPDAGVRYYLAVQPFTAAAPSWEPLWQAMSAHPHPLAFTVGLEPFHDAGSLGLLLDGLATNYGRLATAGRMPEGLWSPGTELAPRCLRSRRGTAVR